MQRRVALLAVLVLLGSAIAPAQQNPFVGSWRGMAQVNGATITFNTVMAPTCATASSRSWVAT